MLLGALILAGTVGLMLLNGVTPDADGFAGWYSVGLVVGAWMVFQGLLRVAEKRRR